MFHSIISSWAAFDCPLFFYVDEDGKIQKDVYNEAFTGYVKYMNALRKNEIISASWQSAESASICSMFANEKSSCVYLSYWWIQPLCNTIVNSKLAQKYGMENTYDAAHDEIIEWNNTFASIEFVPVQYMELLTILSI